MFPFSRRPMAQYWRSRGFTTIEVLVIAFIIGIAAAIAVPSFSGMLDAAKVKQSAVELRSAFQESQRQSLRNNQSCGASVLIPAQFSRSVLVQGDCLAEGNRPLPQGIGIATNVLPLAGESAPPVSEGTPVNQDAPISLGQPFDPRQVKIHQASLLKSLYCAIFPRVCNNPETSNIETQGIDEIEVGVEFGNLGAAQFDIATTAGNSIPLDHSAKFIAFRLDQIDAKKSCVVLSGSLGLTRIGTYQGALNPIDITTQGKCQVADWTAQS